MGIGLNRYSRGCGRYSALKHPQRYTNICQDWLTLACYRIVQFRHDTYLFSGFQEVACDASAGTFTLSFDGAETDSIDFDSDEAGVISALEEISTVSDVNVTFLDGVSQACQAYPSNLGFNVTFLEVPDFRGDLPLMTSNIDNLEVGASPDL